MNSSKNWRIIISNAAEKNLDRIPGNSLSQIEKAIDQMIESPFVGDIDKLRGKENIWRRRVGNYRIIFEINTKNKTIYIYEIKRRTSKSY